MVLPVVNSLVLDRRSAGGRWVGDWSVTTVPSCGEIPRLLWLKGVALGSQSVVCLSRQVVTVGGSATELLQRLIELAAGFQEQGQVLGSIRLTVSDSRKSHELHEAQGRSATADRALLATAWAISALSPTWRAGSRRVWISATVK